MEINDRVIWRVNSNGNEGVITYKQLKDYELAHPGISKTKAFQELRTLVKNKISNVDKQNEKGDSFFRRANDLLNDKENLQKEQFLGFYKSPDLDESAKIEHNYIPDLIKSTNYESDLKVIDGYIALRNKNYNYTANDYLYGLSAVTTNEDMSIDEYKSKLAKILNISFEKVDVSGNKMCINGFGNNPNGRSTKFEYGYRVSFQNSKALSLSDLVYYIEAFNNEARNQNLSYGLKNEYIDNSDVLIIYINKGDLNKVVNVLETIRSNDPNISFIENKFGERKPFTVGVGTNTKYGISTGNGIGSSRFGGDMAVGGTYTGYSQKLMDQAYEKLYTKYSGNVLKINSIEFYQEMLNIHNKNYGFDGELPLWLNANDYNHLYVKSGFYAKK